jgi:hypothetical protein
VPADHLVRQIAVVLDLSWVPREIAAMTEVARQLRAKSSKLRQEKFLRWSQTTHLSYTGRAPLCYSLEYLARDILLTLADQRSAVLKAATPRISRLVVGGAVRHR